MPWFKVDDGFYDHPKVSEVPNAAIGLWVKAGSFSSKHLTDGVISAQQVRALKGTASQIRALIECGLWGETTTESGAKAYSFRNWFEYQPTRESVEESRQLWAEKKRKSRDRKRQDQPERENVPGGVPAMSPQGTSGGVTEMSGTCPVPTRPDPSLVGVHAAASYNVDSGDSELAAAVDRAVMVRPGSRPGLASAVANLTRQGYLDDDIIAGLKAWQARPDAGPGLLRNLVSDAQEQRLERKHIDAERTLIDACDMCDDRGLVDTTDTDGRPVALRCDHTTPPAPPASTHTAFQPASDPEVRKRLLNRSDKPTVPQPPF